MLRLEESVSVNSCTLILKRDDKLCLLPSLTGCFRTPGAKYISPRQFVTLEWTAIILLIMSISSCPTAGVAALEMCIIICIMHATSLLLDASAVVGLLTAVGEFRWVFVEGRFATDPRDWLHIGAGLIPSRG